MGNPLSYTDPFGLWPFGAPKSGFSFGNIQVPSEKNVISQLQAALEKGGTCKDKAQANQIAKDIVNEVGWGDLSLAQSLMESLQNGTPLTPTQQTSATNFINRLPAPGRDPLRKLLNGGGK